MANITRNFTAGKMNKVVDERLIPDGEYIDALARTRPKSLHHVYEWNKAGNKSSRLFKLNKLSENGLSFRVNYEFKPSRSLVPSETSRRRHMFINKAEVMERGLPLTIRPKN
mgnify:CR=1 FL=1